MYVGYTHELDSWHCRYTAGTCDHFLALTTARLAKKTQSSTHNDKQSSIRIIATEYKIITCVELINDYLCGNEFDIGEGEEDVVHLASISMKCIIITGRRQAFTVINAVACCFRTLKSVVEHPFSWKLHSNKRKNRLLH